MYMHREPTITMNDPIVCSMRTCTPNPKYAAISNIKAIRDKRDVLIDCMMPYWKLICWM